MRFDGNLRGGKAQVLLCADTGEALPVTGVPGERCDCGDCGGDEMAVLSEGLPCILSEPIFGVAPACSAWNQSPQFAGDDGSSGDREPFPDDDADDADDDDDDDFFPDDADDEEDDHVADDDDQDDDFE